MENFVCASLQPCQVLSSVMKDGLNWHEGVDDSLEISAGLLKHDGVKF